MALIKTYRAVIGQHVTALTTRHDPSSNAIKVRKLIRFGLKKRAWAPRNAVSACGLSALGISIGLFFIQFYTVKASVC